MGIRSDVVLIITNKQRNTLICIEEVNKLLEGAEVKHYPEAGDILPEAWGYLFYDIKWYDFEPPVSLLIEALIEGEYNLMVRSETSWEPEYVTTNENIPIGEITITLSLP